MKIKLECRACTKEKESYHCDSCDYETSTTEYAINPNSSFVKGLCNEENPFRYVVMVDGVDYAIEFYGEDDKGVYLELYREDRTMKIYPKE